MPVDDTSVERIPNQVLYWVGLYLVSLSYGGPEEGGQWYESGELVTEPELYQDLGHTPRAFFERDTAHRFKARLERNVHRLNQGRPPMHASTSTGLYEVHVMHALTLPVAFPASAPRYG